MIAKVQDNQKLFRIIFIWYSRTRASQVAQRVKNPPANSGDARDAVSIPGLGRFPGRGNGKPLQYSSLEISMDRKRSLTGYSAWGHKESDMTSD